MRHPVLGPRLIECADIVARARAGTAEQIFGPVDAMKLHSSMTLFMRAEPEQAPFEQVLDATSVASTDAATDQRI
jgi:uncharacterized protein (DUF1810 family)